MLAARAVPDEGFFPLEEGDILLWMRAVDLRFDSYTVRTSLEIENWDEYLECKARRTAYVCVPAMIGCLAGVSAGGPLGYFACLALTCAAGYLAAAKSCFDEYCNGC